MRDAIDNRNMEILVQTWANTDSAHKGGNPRKWAEPMIDVVLRAMRQAGDEALLHQVTVKLGRAFGSTKDVRGGARLMFEGGLGQEPPQGDDYDVRTLDSVPLQPQT